MNIIRAEENALLIWNAARARTAYISGEELLAVKLWAHGNANPFSDRLEKLGILSHEKRADIIEAIQMAEHIKAPRNAFNAPESLHIELTEQCPLNCPMCYKPTRKSELPLDFLLDVIRQAGAMRVF